jgi:DUF971 family protein
MRADMGAFRQQEASSVLAAHDKAVTSPRRKSNRSNPHCRASRVFHTGEASQSWRRFGYDARIDFVADASLMAIPTEITLHQRSNVLEVTFETGERFELPCEYLRVYSPSAEVRGHGPGQDVLQVGKRGIGIRAIEPVGTYAVKLVFTDGHDTGLYSWDYLYGLAREQTANWQDYLNRLATAGATREP